MEAPKKIWMDAYSAKYDWNETSSSEDIPYIREDVVLKLVEALEGLLAYSGIIEERDSNCATNKARAALKALEESNGN